MHAGDPVRDEGSYLYVRFNDTGDVAADTVFYGVSDEALAQSLLRLFDKEYADTERGPTFLLKAASEISDEERILLDEQIDDLEIYADPDPGVYDPQPSHVTWLRATFSRRAARWVEIIQSRLKKPPATGSTENPTPEDALAESLAMPEEDRRVSGLALLMLLAQAYYKMLECATSAACGVVDMELNHSYLWVTTSLTNLLKNHVDLKDFPVKFEPIFPNLFPTTIRDIDWDDMVAPDAERLLSTVQKFVHDKGIYEPEKGSPAWTFVELFRPSVETAIEQAVAYNERMRHFLQRALNDTSAKANIPTRGPINAAAAPEPGRDVPNAASLLDSFDRLILSAMHEFEYDPCRSRHGPRPRLSPVPLYLIYAATIPLSKQRIEGRREPMIEADVHARVEALKTLGFVRDGERNWQEFSFRTMRDGRFIDVDSELGDGPRSSKSRPECTIAQIPYRKYTVRFGDCSNFDAALETAGYNEPDADHQKIFKSVMRSFPQLSWYYYDEVSKKEHRKNVGIPYREELSSFGLCYALTPSGIAIARAASTQAGDSAGTTGRDRDSAVTPMSDDKYEWARQIELVRATDQVLGAGTLDKGVLSRACSEGHIETNDRPGKARRARVHSFLTWVRKHFDIDTEELKQVRNAVIGEISARNS